MKGLPRTVDEWIPWVVRTVWALLPLAAGPALGNALDGASGPVRLLASAGLWVGWAAGVAGTFIPHTLSLTALRALAPASVALVIAAAIGGHESALGIGWAVVATAALFTPAWGSRCVNGTAYPNERRFLLRVPAPLLVGPLPLAWALSGAGMAAGPLLLTARQWVGGGLALVVGAPLAFILLRAIHTLSRRWIVFVPAGMVLHDAMTLAEPVLVKRASVSRLGPAMVGGAGIDLSQRAAGLVLAFDLTDDLELNLVHPGRRETDQVSGRTVLFTPTRPGALLAEAKQRRLPVG